MKALTLFLFALLVGITSLNAHALAGKRVTSKRQSDFKCKAGEKLIYVDRAEGGAGPTCIKSVKKSKVVRDELPCPEDSVTYVDKSEGGPGFYCECPQEKIIFIDGSEGGAGLTCAQ